MARRLGNISRETIPLLILFVAQQKPSRGGLWHPILMQFYSGPLMQLLSGVDNGRITDFARAVSHWSQEARSASNLGELGGEAARRAKTGKICTIVAPTNYHWEDANPPPIPPAPSPRSKVAAEAIAHAADMLAQGKKTGLVLGNVALHGKPLETAGRIAAKTGAVLLSETFPSFHLSRGEGRPPVDLIPYEYEVCVKFLENFEQLVFVGALFPVSTFAYKHKPTMKSPPGCQLFAMASVNEDLV